MNKKLLNMFGVIEDIKINSEMWKKLHEEKKDYWFKKEFNLFLENFNFESTVFNLNCLDELNGVILTEA